MSVALSALPLPPKPRPHYVGRFAPSPSGPLHFGSLVSALASYLDARAAQGQWLVRMDDIDPPREQPGAAEHILECLTAHGLHWDGDVLWQSTRAAAYLETLDYLGQQQLIYPCDCTRQTLAASGHIYNGHCRHKPPTTHPVALRLKLHQLPTPFASLPDELIFTDTLQGVQRQNLASDVGDAIVRRKDGLFAYQLAVVVDDVFQGITHVVRGCDLLDVTARQIRLFGLLGQTPPTYSHIPVALGADGQKLSKQNHAAGLENRQARQNLWQALCFLRQNPPLNLASGSIDALLAWAIEHWQPERLAGARGYTPDTGYTQDNHD